MGIMGNKLRILESGANGFICRRLCNQLQQRGHTVIAVLRLARRRIMDWQKPCRSLQSMENAIAEDNDTMLRQQLTLMVPENHLQE